MVKERMMRRSGALVIRARLGFAALLFSGGAFEGALAQELEPRAYVNTPIGLNFLVADYRLTDGNIAFSPATPLSDGKITTHAGTLGYLRAVDLFGMSSKVGVIVPFAAASGSAVYEGERRSRSVTGFGDPRFRLSVNFLGAPAMSLGEFQAFKQDLILGATVEVTAPLGQYDDLRLLNIGTNRWSFKTELGASKAFDDLTLEASAAATFFLPNSDYLGGGRFEQDPLLSAQAHAIYSFRPGIWASLDGLTYWGGGTKMNGQRGESLGNVRLGFSLSLDLTRYTSVKLHGSTGVFSRTGTDFDTIGLAWLFRWGAGL